MKELIIGDNLEESSGEISELVSRILEGKVCAKRVDRQTDGDTRYWGVDLSQSALLGRLKHFGEKYYIEQTGKLPVMSFVMINDIDSKTCPNGSGGGWHRDSFRAQYKAFAYLTDVDQFSQGAFCFIPDSNSMSFRLISLLARVLYGGNRYSDRSINALLTNGFSSQPVLLKAGIPFFLNTSLIHRGLPIAIGRRLMMAVYMFEQVTEEFACLR